MEYTQTTTVLIAARYAPVRAGLRTILESERYFRVVGDVGSSVEISHVAPELAPDVILIDYSDSDGLKMVNAVVDDGAALVVLGTPLDLPTSLPEIARNGVALLGHDAESSEIIVAVRSASLGLVTIEPSMLTAVANHSPASITRSITIDRENGEPLSGREHEVLQLLSQGLPNKQIATKLKISQHTAKFHVASILTKLGASSRTEAVTLGARRGDLIL